MANAQLPQWYYLNAAPVASQDASSQVRIKRWNVRKRKFANCSTFCPRKSLSKIFITTSTFRKRSGSASKQRNAASSLIKKRSRGAWRSGLASKVVGASLGWSSAASGLHRARFSTLCHLNSTGKCDKSCKGKRRSETLTNLPPRRDRHAISPDRLRRETYLSDASKATPFRR